MSFDVPHSAAGDDYEWQPRLRIPRKLAAIAPRLGDTIGLMLDPTLYLFEKYLQHGPVFTMKTPYLTYTVLAGVEAANLMSSKQGRECLTVGSSWRFVEEEFGGHDSLVAVDGDQHRKWRTLLQRGYSREAVSGRYDDAVQLIDDTVDKHWQCGDLVPILSAMQKLSIAQVGTFVGGVRPTDDEVDDIALVTREILKIAPVQHMPRLMLRLPRYTKPKSRVVAVARKAITRAHDSADDDAADESILLRDIMQSGLDDPGSTNGRNTLFHCVLPYFAGVETTSATATYALYLIHKHPKVLARIRAEVDDLFRGPPLTQEALFRSTPVLHGAVTEAMRLYPIASFLIRVAARDFDFAGHRVNRGEHVFIGTTVPHFLAEYYSHPMVFDVDRYGGSAVPHRMPGVYSPFGRGPHMCIGKGLAETLMQLTLARIIHRRELELTSPTFRLSNRLSSSSPSGRFALRVNGVRR